MGWKTSKSRMRSAMAWMMSFALLNVIGVCPLLAHQVPVSHSCCERSPVHSVPCTDTTSNTCPYSLLEKSQGKAGFQALLLAPVVNAQVEANRPVAWISSLSGTNRQADLSGTYLFLR